MEGMIPYPELEKAIKRWNVRQAGGEPAANDNLEAQAEVVAGAQGHVREVHTDDVMESSGLSFVDIETDPGIRRP
jgi:hypothetical protein